MNKNILIERLEDGSIKIRLTPVDGTTKGYKLFFENEFNSGFHFFTNMRSESRVLSATTCTNIKAGSVIYFQFKSEESNEYQPSYEVILEDCKWVNDHIDMIRNQLHEQVQTIKYETEVEDCLKQIEKAVRDKNYCTLIQGLIKKYAPQMTSGEVMDIQRTLTEAKEDKGLSYRPSMHFGF